MYINSEHKKAQELLDEQKFEKSLIAFNNALTLDPNHPDILSHRGVLFLHMNEEEKCMEDLELSLRLDDGYGYRYAALAYAKDYFGDLDTAIELYEKAVQVDPDDSISYNNLGLLMEKRGYKQKAKENFDRADKLSEIENDMFDKMEELERIENNFHSKKEEKTNVDSIQDNALPKPGSQLKGEQMQATKIKTDPPKTFGSISKDLVTDKGVFKEFIAFIKNGFKLKK